MARDEAYRTAEQKIEKAQRSGAKDLDLSSSYGNDTSQLTELPESLRQLTQLQSLQLSGNPLTALPEWLGVLTQLQSLSLSDCQLTALPEWLGRFTQLRLLDLSHNGLMALPEWFGALTQLQELDLSHNGLMALPEWFDGLTQLQSLNLSGCKLTALPEWLGGFAQLRSLSLSGCQLTALPEWLGGFAQLRSLSLSGCQLTALPESLGRLTHLRSLNLYDNQLTALPQSLDQLTQLQSLELAKNQLRVLPEWLGRLTRLSTLHVWKNPLTDIPAGLAELPHLETVSFNSPVLSEIPTSLFDLRHLRWLDLSGSESLTRMSDGIGRLGQLRRLDITDSKVASIPDTIGRLSKLNHLGLSANQLTDIPTSLAQLKHLDTIDLRGNPLNQELEAVHKEGVEAVKRYLRAKSAAQVKLNEAKLILIGEGDVGKSCLLGALRGDPWVEGNPTTHGIEIKPVNVTDPDTGTQITANGWDFGGQRIYRPTHQLFFSAPAVYLVVWKPREGPQQGFVKEWITLVKHRAPEAKILVVATHGGPKQRQPDIDRQEIWDLFGKDMVVDFFLVDSKPDKKTKKRKGIDKLKNAIARAAASLPEMGRRVPKRWEEVRQALKKNGAAYLSLEQVLILCRDRKMDEDEAKDFIRVSHRLGHLIHYEHDPLLQDIVVLKPDWLSVAISFVLDDEQTRRAHGLVSFERLAQLWDDPKRPKSRYPAKLHPIFLRLMERYDLSYRVPDPQKGQSDETSLIAQLVPDVRPPERDLNAVWSSGLTPSDEQQVQICRIVDAITGQSAAAEGLFFRLIVRLHKYSLGRVYRDQSVHWQRGLVLDDDYNGRALLENLGNDVRITVRAAYPERFLSVLTYEVRWLVENFWKGLRCEVTVPCMAPCGKGFPGAGLFEVEKLITFKRQGMQLFPCFVSGCSQAQDIDGLLRNAPAARRTTIETFLANHFDEMRSRLDAVREQVAQQDSHAQDRFRLLDRNDRRILSQLEDAYTSLMQALTDEAKEGPRLFSFEPVDRRFFDRPKWLSAKFRLTLWCEHSRLPLPALNGKDDMRGVYELNLPREWIVKSMPYLKLLTGLLSLVVPVAASAAKLELDEVTYKSIEKQLDFGQKSLESVLKGGEKAADWASEGDAPNLERGDAIRARGAVLRQLHTWLKEKDASFGGLVRVQNRRQEFLWVHPNFESEY